MPGGSALIILSVGKITKAAGAAPDTPASVSGGFCGSTARAPQASIAAPAPTNAARRGTFHGLQFQTIIKNKHFRFRHDHARQIWMCGI